MDKGYAIVTGSNRGVGYALIKRLAEAGYNVFACSRKESIEFEENLSMINSLNPDIRIKPLYFELTDTEEIKRALKKIKEEKVRVSILINNAGIGHMGYLQMTKEDFIRKIYEVNVFAPILLSQMVIPMMRKNKYGRIINISSTAAQEVYEGNSIYGSSKAALEAFTKSFAPEVYSYGITVNAIAPGLIDTDMSEVFEGKNPKEPLRHTALGRKIKPDEIADIVVSLLKDEMNIINGEVITVNGGHK